MNVASGRARAGEVERGHARRARNHRLRRPGAARAHTHTYSCRRNLTSERGPHTHTAADATSLEFCRVLVRLGEVEFCPFLFL